MQCRAQSGLASIKHLSPRSFVPDKKSCMFTTLTKTITRRRGAVWATLMVRQEVGWSLSSFRGSLVMMGRIQGWPKHHNTKEKASASEK